MPGPRPFECVKRSWHSDRHQPLRGSIIQQIFRVVNENHSPGTKKNREWQEKLAVVVLKSEEIMYSKADSEAEYLNSETLWERLNDAIDTIIRKDESMETGEFLHPCVEAALNLGCVPIRSTRSQRNTNIRSYLSPRNHNSSPNAQHVPNVQRSSGASQTHTLTSTTAASSSYPQNVPRQMTSFENRTSSVYPLYHGFHFQPPAGVPQMGFDNTHLNQNNVIIGTPVYQTTRESLPSSSQTGHGERLFLSDQDSKKEFRPEFEECDLSLRLGLVSSDDKRLTIVDDDDVDLGPRNKEFSFFPLNSDTEEGKNLVTDVRKRKTIGELQSFSQLERDFDRIKRQGL